MDFSNGLFWVWYSPCHYDDVIMSAIASQMHQPYDCLLNGLFRRRSKKTWKLRVIGLCAGNSPGTGEFAAQMASNAENISIWWRHHVLVFKTPDVTGQVRTLSTCFQRHECGCVKAFSVQRDIWLPDSHWHILLREQTCFRSVFIWQTMNAGFYVKSWPFKCRWHIYAGPERCSILQWSHNGCDSVSNHRPHDCLLNRLFKRRWKKTSKFRVTGLCTNGQ